MQGQQEQSILCTEDTFCPKKWTNSHSSLPPPSPAPSANFFYWILPMVVQAVYSVYFCPYISPPSHPPFTGCPGTTSQSSICHNSNARVPVPPLYLTVCAQTGTGEPPPSPPVRHVCLCCVKSPISWRRHTACNCSSNLSPERGVATNSAIGSTLAGQNSGGPVCSQEL